MKQSRRTTLEEYKRIQLAGEERHPTQLEAEEQL